MSTRFYKEIALHKPLLLCGWSGIGSVGLTAVNTLRRLLRMERLGEVEPCEFFEPSEVMISNGLIKQMRFPTTRLYSHRRSEGDLVLLSGEQQPAEERGVYEMANQVLDLAARFGCARICTMAASVTMVHHTARPRVWAVPNTPALIPELGRYSNTILVSQAGGEEGRGDGMITGLNGLLLGVAKNRGIEAVCLMGEVPYYLQAAPWPYPKASISVLETLGEVLGLQLDLSKLHQSARKVQTNIEQILDALANAEELPEQVRAEMRQLRYPQRHDLGPITEREKREILEHLDELFKGEERS